MNRGFGPLRLPDLPEAPTPIGAKCLHCGERIEAWDSGEIMPRMNAAGVAEAVPVHRECEIRNVVGSVGHQRGLCKCNGGPGTMDDPPGLSRRAAAFAAEREFLYLRGGCYLPLKKKGPAA